MSFAKNFINRMFSSNLKSITYKNNIIHLIIVVTKQIIYFKKERTIKNYTVYNNYISVYRSNHSLNQTGVNIQIRYKFTYEEKYGRWNNKL